MTLEQTFLGFSFELETRGNHGCHSLLHVDTYYLLMNLVMVYFSADYGDRLTAIAAVKSRRSTVAVDNRN